MPRTRVSETFILQNRSAQPADTYAYLLAELAALDVVRIETTFQRPHPQDVATVRYDYLLPGPNFDRYPMRAAQTELIRDLHQQPRIALHILAKDLRERPDPKLRIAAQLDRANLALQGMRLLRPAQGRRYHRAVKRALKELSRNFYRWSVHEPEKLRTSVSRLGLLVLLTPRLDFAYLAKLEPLFQAETWPQATRALSGPVYYDWGDIHFSCPWEAFRALDSQVYKFEQAFERIQSQKENNRLSFYYGLTRYG